MAEVVVTRERIKAGFDYLESLKALGFEPEGAFWSVRVGEPDSLELSVFTSIIDRLGSRRVFRALFEAYEHAKTPKSFDPWQVSLYSPRQLFYDTVTSANIFEEKNDGSFIANEMISVTSTTERRINGMIVEVREDYSVKRFIEREWVYRIPTSSVIKREATDAKIRRFERFERDAKLAA